MTKNKVKNTKTKMRRAVKKLGKQKIKVTDIRVNNQALVTDENQARVNFLKSLYSLRMNLSGVAKNLNGYGYKYQNFNEIIREIKNVIKSNNLDIDFLQCPTFKVVGNNTINVITTTFYSPSSGYCESFDTPIYTEEFSSLGAKNQNTLSQLVGSCITYHKRYALVGYLSIESEVDTDASSLLPELENNRERVKAIAKNNDGNTQVNISGNNVEDKNTVHTDQSKSKSNVETNKFKYYRNLLIAARNMHKFVLNKPFNSLEEINSYLKSIQVGDDSSILEYFNKNKTLKSIQYWCNLIKEYFSKSSRDPEKIEKFDVFLAFDLDKLGNSPLKLFGHLSTDKEFDCLFRSA
ncbi:ERF family protein [Borrelia puertoricensis]|uniref:ERF family protein n=1 Tax=Borrelia puertoricensis TaxID=2756107 RepID=UPI001FF318E8|nr:ERF family protein [Borrelia puertoricensis]